MDCSLVAFCESDVRMCTSKLEELEGQEKNGINWNRLLLPVTLLRKSGIENGGWVAHYIHYVVCSHIKAALSIFGHVKLADLKLITF